MKKLIYIIIFIACISVKLFAQLSIKGANCVIPGVTYHYKISGNWDSASTMQVCVTGGVIRNRDSSEQNCTAPNGAPLGGVRVIWNGPGSINVVSSKGSASLSVTPTSALQAGTIAPASQTQMVALNATPSPINCNPDSGGSCSPKYSYQWQQSADRVSWVNIPGATNAALNFSSPLATTTFYRRQVTETKSGTIAYSDVAAVFAGIGDTPMDSVSTRNN